MIFLEYSVLQKSVYDKIIATTELTIMVSFLAKQLTQLSKRYSKRGTKDLKIHIQKCYVNHLFLFSKRQLMTRKEESGNIIMFFFGVSCDSHCGNLGNRDGLLQFINLSV